LEKVAITGDSTGTIWPPFGSFVSLSPAINSTGDVAFHSTNGNTQVSWYHSSNGFQNVVALGQAAPVNPSGYYADGMSSQAISDTGRIAITSLYHNAPGSDKVG